MADWLDELDVNEIPDDEFVLPRNTYVCRTVGYKAPAVQSKNEDLAYFILNWQIDEGDYETYSSFGQWIALPPIFDGYEEDGSPAINSEEHVKDFDPRNIRDHKTLLIRLKKVVEALGYGADEFKDILKRIVKNDFTWCDDRMALVTASSYKNAGGYTQVKVHDIALYERPSMGDNDVDPLDNGSSKSSTTEVPF